MNVLLINDSSSNANWGDRAAAIALKQMIATCGGTLCGVFTETDLIDSNYSGQEQGIQSGDAGGTRSVKNWVRLFLPPVIIKLRNKILDLISGCKEDGPIPMTLDEFDLFADAFIQDKTANGDMLEAIENSHIVVIHGDGCMVGNGIMPRAELFLAYLAKTRFNKPVILINHTVDLDHPDLNRMAEAVYPLLDDVAYRDQTSVDLCKGRWPGRYAADSAFQFMPADRDGWIKLARRATYFDIWPDEATFDPARPYICIGGSSIYPAVYSLDKPMVDAIDGYISLVSHLQKVYPGQIVLTVSDGRDKDILRPVAKELDLPLTGLTIPVQQAVDIIGNSQAYIGGRWHPSIFALRGGAPVIPISSKTFKMQALVNMAGLPIATFNALKLSDEKDNIAQVLNNFIKEGETLRQKLREWAQRQAESSWSNVDYLNRFGESGKLVNTHAAE